MNNFAVVSGKGPASRYLVKMLLQRCNIVTKDSLDNDASTFSGGFLWRI
jgi:hypothetical protein